VGNQPLGELAVSQAGETQALFVGCIVSFQAMATPTTDPFRVLTRP
jgi:hypothetical protein